MTDGGGPAAGADAGVLDAHCHAWRSWPYARTAALKSAGTPDRLLRELNANGVATALVVCAEIGGGRGGDGWPNPSNNADVASAARTSAGRLEYLVDVDSWWSPDYHRPRAAERLEAAAVGTGAVGFTHYLHYTENDGWLRDPEADRLFATAARRELIASIPVIGQLWLADLEALVQRHPEVPVLLHHLGLPRPDHLEADVAALAALAALPNLGVKVSGPYYSVPDGEPFPFDRAGETLSRLYDAFGPGRLFWGSDWPVSTPHMSYAQSLEVFDHHAAFMTASERSAVRGGNLAALLGRRR